MVLATLKVFLYGSGNTGDFTIVVLVTSTLVLEMLEAFFLAFSGDSGRFSCCAGNTNTRSGGVGRTENISRGDGHTANTRSLPS